MSTPTLTEQLIEQVAPDNAALQAGRGLRKKIAKLGISADGTWLLGECQGSAKLPYQVSVDLINPSAPLGRCNCPSRKFPCKHALGLMFAYVNAPEKFGKREPSADLLAKRGLGERGSAWAPADSVSAPDLERAKRQF